MAAKKAADKVVSPGARFTNFLSKIFPKKPATYLSAQALETFKFDDIDFHTKKGKKLLYTIYRRHPTLFQMCRLRSSIGVPSVEIKTEDTAAQKVIAEMLKNLHPSGGLTFLKSWLRDLWIVTDVFGTGFVEPLWDKKHMNYLGLKNVHPISMDLLRQHGEKSLVKVDESGNPVGWLEELENQNKKKEHAFDDIKYLVFNQIGDEILGLSLLEPIYKTTWRLMNIEEGIASAIFRHGFPLYDITVSGAQEGRPPTKAQLDDAAKEVRGLNYKSEFIHPPNYKVKLMEAFSIGKGSDYTDTFIDMITSGSGLPRFFLMGSARELSRASALELQKPIQPSIKPSQEKLKLFFEKEILEPLMKANHIKEIPELILGEFKPATVKEEHEESGREKRGLQHFAEKKLPGLYLVQPHANLIYEGDKKQIIKSETGMKMLRKYVGKEMFLLSEDKVFGVIKLREPREIDVNDFIQLRYAHRVSDEERKEWWPGKKKLFAYEFEIVEMFEKLKHFDVPKGVQVLVKEVEIK
ncbi:MAG: hypothetical protein E3J56_00975 [Candidatus Aminicenantes bacterium]|nr:MAG: hypothetical protein E3J56_00975 [Candidatus Aminicenantes bacterium]